MGIHYRAGAAFVLLLLAALGCNLTSGGATSGTGQQPAIVTATPPLAVVPTTGAGDLGILPTEAAPTSTPLVLPTAIPATLAASEPTSPVPTEVAALACNQACYGHDQVMVAFKSGQGGVFGAPGHRIAVQAINRLETGPYDPVGNRWGIALLRVQADLPNTLPGQNVTIIAFGEASVTDVGGSTPMQAITITTGSSGPACQSAPEAGVLLQNDTGEVASLNVNGVDLLVGSTVLIQAQPQRDMVLAVLEGQVDATALGQRVSAITGSQLRVPLDAALRPIQVPRLESLDLSRLQTRPITPLLEALPLRVTLPSPLQRIDVQIAPLVPRLRDNRPGLLRATATPTPTPTATSTPTPALGQRVLATPLVRVLPTATSTPILIRPLVTLNPNLRVLPTVTPIAVK
jgi:hypothetical protein